MSRRILIVEHDRRIAEMVQSAPSREGCSSGNWIDPTTGAVVLSASASAPATTVSTPTTTTTTTTY